MGAVAPAGSRGREGSGAKPPSPHQKLKAFRCISSTFLYFLGGIVEIQYLDLIYMFTVTELEQSLAMLTSNSFNQL